MLYPDVTSYSSILGLFFLPKTNPKMALVNELGDSTGESYPKIDRLNVVTWLLAYITRDYKSTLNYRKYISEWRYDFDSWNLKTYTIYTPARVPGYRIVPWKHTRFQYTCDSLFTSITAQVVPLTHYSFADIYIMEIIKQAINFTN